MAISPAHRFGQIIGDVLEAAIVPLLERFAKENGLYLDKKGPRPCRKGKKCSWTDLNGNTHDLDYVLERGGSKTQIGQPVAFIETAWRRYTKHSRNKAQEIQGAILPLAETYRGSHPFKGAVWAGVFTSGAISQLRSLGFAVLYVSYDSVVQAFRKSGIDANFDERTPDQEFLSKVESYLKLTASRRKQLASRLIRTKLADVQTFFESLSSSVLRQIERVLVLALHGRAQEVATVDEAIRAVEGYCESIGNLTIVRYEIQIRYTNGDQIRGEFADKVSAVEFLKTYRSQAHSPVIG